MEMKKYGSRLYTPKKPYYKMTNYVIIIKFVVH